MSEQLPPPPAYVPTAEDEYAFRRRRTHAHIEAMSGLILQAIAYPTRRHRDFICALQSANSGNDAKVPYTPFRRAHLTLAEYMKYDGSPETRRKAVYREICCLRRFQRTTGIVIFHVTPGNEEEATEYIDYLTPLADAAMQRALASPLWKTDKVEAKRQAVAWAVSMLPRIPIEEDEEAESKELSLHDYERVQEERFYQSIERTADEIEKRGGDHRWIERVAKQLLQIAASRKKTAGARRPDASLRAARAAVAGVEGRTAEESGDLYNVGQFRPVTESDTFERGEDRSVLPPPSDTTVADLDRTTADGQGGRTDLSSPPPDHLEAALAYARRGWAVFPLHNPVEGGACSCSQGKACRSTGKHPRTRQGLKDATTVEGQVQAWWRRWPEANVGLAMGKVSGLVALDVDPRSGGDASLAELFDEHSAFPVTLEALTGGGGFHFLFSHPGVKFKNSSSVLGEGLDIKTDGGYIVAAPSLHASGKRYEWRGMTAPSPLPEWLLTLLTTERAKPEGKAVATAAPRRTAATASGGDGGLIPAGERNKRLFRIACALRGDGSTHQQIVAELAEINSTRCAPPLDEGELRRIASSAARYQPEAKRRGARAQGATG